jgi:hypothetical protein
MTSTAFALFVSSGLLLLGFRLLDVGNQSSGLAAVFAGVLGWSLVLSTVWQDDSGDNVTDQEPPA